MRGKRARDEFAARYRTDVRYDLSLPEAELGLWTLTARKRENVVSEQAYQLTAQHSRPHHDPRSTLGSDRCARIRLEEPVKSCRGTPVSISLLCPLYVYVEMLDSRETLRTRMKLLYFFTPEFSRSSGRSYFLAHACHSRPFCGQGELEIAVTSRERRFLLEN